MAVGSIKAGDDSLVQAFPNLTAALVTAYSAIIYQRSIRRRRSRFLAFSP
jgi:hypothetical protein